ncbi:MAG: hypothetical protein GXP40_07285 [Chloroflexi bacterium]|nr:hypothetical protein [Chloroflexota bacterium]
MGRYGQYQRAVPKKPKNLHPAWRGIGCLIGLILPVISYAGAAVLLTNDAVKKQVPWQLLGPPSLPPFLWEYIPAIRPALSTIYGWTDLEATLVLAFVLLVILGSVVSLVYAMMYRVVGPPRYGPRDMPPPRRKIKKYKR